MGNPFEKISAENAKLRENYGGSSTSLNIERYAKSYSSIYDEYASVSSELRGISSDIKAEMEAETKRTEKELQKQQNKAALFSFINTAATQLPQIVTGITSLINTAKGVKTGDTSGLQNLEQKLTQAKQQSTTYGNTLNEANSQKPTYEQQVKDQEAERVKQQGLYDKYKQQEEDLQASLDNGTDSQLAAANKELTEAKNMKTTKKVRNAQGQIKEVEDATLKANKEQKIKDANDKIEKRKQELKEAIAKAKADKEAAQKANAAAIQARDEAQAKVDELKKKINEITPQKTKLDNEIKQLEAEVQRIKGGSTSTTTTTQKTGGSEPSTR